jgi:hypothetical protein
MDDIKAARIEVTKAYLVVRWGAEDEPMEMPL